MNGDSPGLSRLFPLVLFLLLTAWACPALSVDINALIRMAEGGDAKAQVSLGLAYHKGSGVPQDHAKAVKWYRKAAEQGNASARCNLGNAYSKGNGVPQDYAEAVKWYRMAAEQGLPRAQLNLGNAYSKGNGVPQDFVLAYFWYSLSASNRKGEGDDRSVKARDESAGKLTPDQLGKAQRMTREWVEKHPGK